MAQSISIANTGSFSQLISRDYHKVAFDAYAAPGDEYKKLAKISTTGDAYIREGQMAGLGPLQRRGQGEPKAFDNMLQGNEKTAYPETFSLGFAITEEMWDDDRTGHIRKAFEELGKSAKLTHELLFWDLLNAGFVTTTRTGIDSLALFGAHTYIKAAGTYANYATTPGALSMSTLQESLDRFELMKNEQGRPAPIKADLLIVSPQNRFMAKTLLKSEYNPENANQQYNVLNDEGLQFMVSHYLSSTTAWFLANKKEHDLRYITRKPLKLKSYDDPQTDNAMFFASMRTLATFFNWRGIDGNAGA